MDERQYSSWLLERVAIGDVIRLRIGVSTIGRLSSSTIRINEINEANGKCFYVSRQHAEIEVSAEDSFVEIRDKESVNGVFVNEIQLPKNGSSQLRHEDRIGFGVMPDDNLNIDHPVYIIRYAPLRINSAQVMTISPPVARAVLPKKENLDQPSTSRDAMKNVITASAVDQPSTFRGTITNAVTAFTVNQPSTSADVLTYAKTTPETEKSTLTKSLPPTSIAPKAKMPPPKSSLATEIILLSDDEDNSELVGILEPCQPIVTAASNNSIAPEVPLARNIELCAPTTLPPTTAAAVVLGKPLLHGDHILLSSDDEDEYNDIYIKPNLNSPIQNDLQNPINCDNNIDEHNSADDDIEELMFSQVIINDMKAELDMGAKDDEPNDHFSIKQEPLASTPQTSNKVRTNIAADQSFKDNLDSSSCWIISDDEEFDEESENKLVGWTSKLCSQSFSMLNNMSQIYETTADDDDDDDEEIDDTCNDFFNGLDSDKLIDDIYTSLKHKIESSDSVDSKEHEVEDNDENIGVPIDILDNVNSSNILPVLANKDLQVNKITNNQENNEEFMDRDDVNNKEKKSSIKKADKNSVKQSINAKADKAIAAINIDASSNAVKSTEPKLLENRKLEVENSPLVRRSSKTKRVVSSSDNDFSDTEYASTKKNSSPLPTPTIESNKDHTPIKLKIPLRGPPIVIDAPKLPKHKGKLRGVSAVSAAVISDNACAKKMSDIRESIRSEKYSKDLKRKWTEKPKVFKKRDKDLLKESRKERLKELADKQHHEINEKAPLKRKLSINKDNDISCSSKKPKVKITPVNRGAFLTEETRAHTSKEATKSFRIPKVSKTSESPSSNKSLLPLVNKGPQKQLTTKHNDTASSSSSDKTVPLISSLTATSDNNSKHKNNSSATVFLPSLSRSKSIDQTTFSELLCAPDKLLLKRNNSNDGRNTSVPNNCKDKDSARAVQRNKQNKNKITFASMQKNFIESKQNQKQLERICNTRSCLTENGAKNVSSDAVRKKKTVRFNDTPIVHFIERVNGASKKVDKKDIAPRSSHTNRRHYVRQTYPMLDCTHNIVSLILKWSNEWLIKRNADVQAAGNVIYPMPLQFSSYDHYKSIVFPLMQLEFGSVLEREYNATRKAKIFIVALEYVTENKDRLTLITKFNLQHRNQSIDPTRWDLVILDFGNKSSKFAYVSGNRKGVGTCSTIVFEIISNNLSKDFFLSIKQLIVRPVIDNIRVEFGAFNAVYQLEATPLFQKILNPLELLKCRPPSNKKISYRGCDQDLNEKQRQVLLQTYTKVIDEATPNITLIQGPPGTGKSKVITNLALQCLYGEEVRCMDKKILICAQSNGAVDVIAEQLFRISTMMRPEIRFRVIRYGVPEKIKENVLPISLQQIVQRDQMRKLLARNQDIQFDNKENLKAQMLQLEAQIAELKTRNIKDTFEQDNLIEKQRQLQLMRNIESQSLRPEDERSIYTWHLTNANIVCATLSSCVKLSQYTNYFDICIIDEATQCTEPWTLLPLKFGVSSLVLVGDTQQLPATVLSKKAYDFGLGTSMFTRIQRCLETVHSTEGAPPNGIVCSLQTQYRMNPEICKWPNLYFYKNELINAPITQKFKTPIMPFSILNLAYTQNSQCNNGQITNNLEADFVAKLLKALDGYIPTKYNSYGVITPYAQHRNTLVASLRSVGLSNIMVNTIDSYQGLEKDVIIISNARTNGIGFLANYQRLNVALTRPKKCLILCGNFKNLESVPAWRSLLNNARERKLFHEVGTNCIEDIHTNVIDKIKIKKLK